MMRFKAGLLSCSGLMLCGAGLGMCGAPAFAATASAAVEDVTKKASYSAKNTQKSEKALSVSDDNEMPGSVEKLLVQGQRHRNATTDGTGSYVVKAVSMTKMLLRLDEIPQSVSVVSRQQMHDQNLTTVD